MLTKNELQNLAESRDLEELVTRMKNTIYLDAFAKLTKPYTAEKVETALREYLVNTHAKIVNIAGRNTGACECLIDQCRYSLYGEIKDECAVHIHTMFTRV